jgi:hypothetical protein
MDEALPEEGSPPAGTVGAPRREPMRAGYGAWLWLLVQDLSQLKAVYPKWETFLANTTLQAFGTQDQYTARYLSEAIGSETIVVETAQQSRSAPEAFMRPGSHTQGKAFAAHGRPLLMPDEVRRLSERQVIVLQHGRPPYPRIERRSGTAERNRNAERAAGDLGARAPPDLFPQDPVLGPEVLDDLELLLVHPPREGDQQHELCIDHQAHSQTVSGFAGRSSRGLRPNRMRLCIGRLLSIEQTDRTGPIRHRPLVLSSGTLSRS